MTDLPDYLYLSKDLVPPQFRGFPHRLALLPAGVTLETIGSAPHVAAAFLIDVDCGFDLLNGAALAGYLAERVPVLLHAERRRDLKPFRRRAAVFKARGYVLTEVLGEVAR